MDSTKRHEPVCLLNVRIHILIEGASYDIQTRTASAPAELTVGKLS